MNLVRKKNLYYLFLLQELHKFLLLVLRIFKAMVKLNVLKLKEWEMKKIYQLVIPGKMLIIILHINID